jgi:acyl dehydratase
VNRAASSRGGEEGATKARSTGLLRRLALRSPGHLLLALALDRRPRWFPPETLHGLVLECERTIPTVDPVRLDSYGAQTGYPPGAIPPTYPHFLAAPLHARLLFDPRLPLRARGIVQTALRLQSVGPLRLEPPLVYRASLRGFVQTPRGLEFTLTTDLGPHGNELWREELQLLVPERRRAFKRIRDLQALVPPDDADRRDFSPQAGIGWRHARVSGDLNPIHLNNIFARMLGFPAAVAPGMWLVSRTLAALNLEGRSPLRLEVDFRRFVTGRDRLRLSSWWRDSTVYFQIQDRVRPTVYLEGNAEAR